MKRLFMITGIIFIVMWIFGFVVFKISSEYYHFLIVVGIILILFSLIRKTSDK